MGAHPIQYQIQALVHNGKPRTLHKFDPRLQKGGNLSGRGLCERLKKEDGDSQQATKPYDSFLISCSLHRMMICFISLSFC